MSYVEHHDRHLEHPHGGGMELQSKRKGIGIENNCNDDSPKPWFCKRPKLELHSQKLEAGNPIYSQCRSYDSGFHSSDRDTMVAPNKISSPSLLENDKLNDLNFQTWFQNLRNVLKYEKKEYVLEKPIPAEPPFNASFTVRNTYNKHKDDSTYAQRLMLESMVPNLQKRFENIEAYKIISSLKGLFENRERSERYAIFKAILECKLVKGNPVSPHVKKMISLIERWERLGSPISQEMAIDCILRSLPDEYYPFITKFHDCDPDKTMYELHEMLKTFETTSAALFQEKKCIKKQGRSKGNAQIKNLNKSNPAEPKPKRGAKSEDVCHHCHESGHWKRNCKRYLEEVKK